MFNLFKYTPVRLHMVVCFTTTTGNGDKQAKVLPFINKAKAIDEVVTPAAKPLVLSSEECSPLIGELKEIRSLINASISVLAQQRVSAVNFDQVRAKALLGDIKSRSSSNLKFLEGKIIKPQPKAGGGK